jgi:3-oxoacyl-[acyl-carrier-protein] synthase II
MQLQPLAPGAAPRVPGEPAPRAAPGGPGRRPSLSPRRRAARAPARAAPARAAAAAPPPYGPGAQRRVVVTGTGVVSPLGHDPAAFYAALLAGESGISEISGFDAAGLDFSTRIAGEIKDFDCGRYVERKWVKRYDAAIKYLVVAGKSALESAGVDWADPEALAALDRGRCGVLLGTAMGGMGTFAAASEALVTASFRKMNPFCIPMAISNMGGALLATDLGFMGPNYSISTACATGNFCALNAAEHIRRGDADLMLAGGGDAAVIPSGIGGFIACKALSRRNEEPARASRPWDKGRDGFVMGEGAGVLVLESLEHARARGAPILAEFAGGAFSCDAHHMTEPRPDGANVAACIRLALARARVDPEEVVYVNAHGTSTPAGDMAEYAAITAALPHKGLRINSTKAQIGHLLGGASAVEAVACVEALRTGRLHPNINLDDPEDAVDMSIMVGKEACDLPAGGGVVLSNSFGFGGHNSSIMFRRFVE